MSKLRLISTTSSAAAKLSDDNLRSLSAITPQDIPDYWKGVKLEDGVKVGIAASIRAIAKKALK